LSTIAKRVLPNETTPAETYLLRFLEMSSGDIARKVLTNEATSLPAETHLQRFSRNELARER
jgi:hypothetical protein